MRVVRVSATGAVQKVLSELANEKGEESIRGAKPEGRTPNCSPRGISNGLGRARLDIVSWCSAGDATL